MIKPNSILYSFLSKVKNGFWKPYLMSIELILVQYFNIKKEGNLVQIGSNDGISNDPLRKHLTENSWNAILVEPVPFIFKKLKKNYEGYQGRINFENSIVSSIDGFTDFYLVNENALQKYPAHVDQLSSLTKDVLLKLKPKFPNIEEDIEKLSIPSLTFRTLLEKHNFDKVNLIHIDAEGNDDKILSAIIIEDYYPDIIIFEHIHLSNKRYKTILRKFKKLKYKTYYFDFDTIAINRKLQKQHPEIGKMSIF